MTEPSTPTVAAAAPAATSTPQAPAPSPPKTLPTEHKRELDHAVALLEQPRLAVRIANYAGRPLEGAIGVVPGLSGVMQDALYKAILQCLTVAIDSQDAEVFEPSRWLPKALTGLTGGIGGLFGAFALPLELPLTTTLMLRAIADIARYNGENLRKLEPRLACLQVFALGSRRTESQATDAKSIETIGAVGSAAIGYYATRAALNKLTGELVAGLVERTVLDASAPMMTRLVSEIVSRLGLVWSERLVAGAVPVLGAVGGASLNMLFMDHFERAAEGHFTIRRLERLYGQEAISRLYRIAASR